MQLTDDGNDQALSGPHAGVPAITTPVIVRAAVYSTTYYIHSFDGKLLAEYDATGTCQKDYIYMGNKLIAEYQPVTGAKYYYASDQIHSTRIITDSSGTVVYSALFDPYGGIEKQWVNTYSPSLKFSGKERESKSEMDYFGARYYDHLRYRFISVDPVINKEEALVNPQLWNLYSYCRNNPVTFFDPDGREIRTNDQTIRLAISLAGATNTGGPIVNSAIQSPNVINMENASLETGNTGRLKEGSWVTEGGNFITGNIVEITSQIDIDQALSFGRPIVATVAHELMHGNRVITYNGKGLDAWRAALSEDNLPGTNTSATPTVNGVAGRFGTAVAAEVASGLLTGNTVFLMRAASIFSQIGGNQ
jgi:RHS repeat-associated protein